MARRIEDVLSPTETAAIRGLAYELKKAKVKENSIFGSVARGEAIEDSDPKMVIVLPEIRIVWVTVFSIWLLKSDVISLMTSDGETWLECSDLISITPLYLAVMRDGLTV